MMDMWTTRTQESLSWDLGNPGISRELIELHGLRNSLCGLKGILSNVRLQRALSNGDYVSPKWDREANPSVQVLGYCPL